MFTGKLENMTRDEAAGARGSAWCPKWRVQCRRRPISSLPARVPARKLSEAQKFGVEVIDEDAWLFLIASAGQ